MYFQKIIYFKYCYTKVLIFLNKSDVFFKEILVSKKTSK